MNLQYIKATLEETESVYSIVQDTIKAIYPKYYPTEVVDFFCELHCTENIKRDIEEGRVGVLKADETIVGTGCYTDNHITRVFVLPQYQGQGFGSFIMQSLEDEISKNFDKVILDASLAASGLYEKREYKTVEHCRLDCANNTVLVYEIMEKSLSRILTPINYDGKIELHEEWQWLNGDKTNGSSILVEK